MIIFFATISISLMILLPITLAILLRRRYSVPWGLFVIGMATFVSSQLLHVPLNNWLNRQGLIGPISPGAEGLLLTASVLGLSAGLSETIARVLGFCFVNRMLRGVEREGESEARWQDGFMLGLGHGGIEAMGLIAVLTAASLSSLWALQGIDPSMIDFSPGRLAEAQLQLAEITTAPWQLLWPLVERGLTISLHVVLSLLVWAGVSRRKLLFLLIAFTYHGLVDGIAVYAMQFVQEVWQIQAIVFFMLVPGAIWAWHSRPAVDSTMPRSPMSIRFQLSMFGSAVRKELMQQWRTKRVLVILAVFLLFGLGSPLVAKFTPELLKNIEGAEQFASLIPSPTRADSLEQYVKNITQFGFIIAIVLGMGSVAGEKERGTAAMILSKPIPRWAFVVSKFTAQALVYGLAFVIAALGAFYYTDLLFESFVFGSFLFDNIILWLGMLVFAGVTLVGTVLARTSGAAAGISLIGAVFLLLSGSLPKIGAFTPSGLVVWAGQLGLGVPTPANGGALVASITLIIVCLIIAVAVFEIQEL